MHSTAPQGSSFYTALFNAVEAYCARNGTPRPRNDKARSQILGLGPSALSKIRHNTYPLNGSLIRTIVQKLCADAGGQRLLEAQLRAAATPAMDEAPATTEVEFVRRYGGVNSLLFIEHMGVWPPAHRLTHPVPIASALRDAMTRGMTVMVFLPYAVSGSEEGTRSMGNGNVERDARRTFNALRRMNPDRVGFYCLQENPCPIPGIGIRLTGMRSDARPESALFIANGTNDSHFLPVSTVPTDLIVQTCGFFGEQTREGKGLPTQEDLNQLWEAEAHARSITDGRPCPVRRIG